MAILPKACKSLNVIFESHNSLKLSFTHIRGLRLNFVDCESFLEKNSLEILAVWDKPDWLNWFWQLLHERLSLFNPKKFWYSYAWHGLAVYVKEGLPFARDLPPENSADSYLCFRLALLHSLSYFFFLYRS